MQTVDNFQIGDEMFIWGVPSDRSDSEASFATMNDIELTYNISDFKYTLFIETIYVFETVYQEIDYYHCLLEKLQCWMTDKGIDFRAVTEQVGKELRFATIPDAHEWLYNFVNSLRALYKYYE